MKIKNILVTFAAAGLILGAISCAKVRKEGTNESAQRFFEAWMQHNYPDVQKSGLGIYVIEDGQGTTLADGMEGSPAGLDFTDATYVYVIYTVRDLDGNITQTNDWRLEQQLGDYVKTDYHGPQVWINNYSSIPTGVKEMLAGMKIRDKRTAVIPGWLMGTKEYKSEEEYLKKVKGNDNCIYTIEVVDSAKNVYNKEIERILGYGFDYIDNDGTPRTWVVSEDDCDYHGYYFLEISKGDVKLDEKGEEKPLSDNTEIKINYTGRLLSGQVFDTTDEKTAKDNGIYSPSKSYKSVSATWSSDSTAVKLAGSTVIVGFASTLKRLKHHGARGVGIFYSPVGYGTSGSGSKIPGYAPLIFEVEIEKEEE